MAHSWPAAIALGVFGGDDEGAEDAFNHLGLAKMVCHIVPMANSCHAVSTQKGGAWPVIADESSAMRKLSNPPSNSSQAMAVGNRSSNTNQPCRRPCTNSQMASTKLNPAGINRHMATEINL